MQWESVLAWRVERQHLARRATDPLAVVSDICGLHAQVMSSAQLTLRARVEDAPDVEDLLWKRRVLVKTWAMRGTLHLLRADELALYLGAQGGLKPRYEQASWLKHFGLTAEQAQSILTDVPAALREGPPTREELAARVHAGLSRGYGDLLKPVAFRGQLIFAPSEGQNVRFARATSAPERIYRPGGWFSPVLLVDGVMAGVLSRDGDVTVEPFAPVGNEVRAAAEAEAARLPGAPSVTWG